MKSGFLCADRGEYLVQFVVPVIFRYLRKIWKLSRLSAGFYHEKFNENYEMLQHF